MAVSVGSATQVLTPVATLPDGVPGTYLAGVRSGYALLLLARAATPPGTAVAAEAVLVDLGSGRMAVGLPPEGAVGALFTFAGWISSSP